VHTAITPAGLRTVAPATPRRRRWPLLAGTAAVLLVVGLGAGRWLAGRRAAADLSPEAEPGTQVVAVLPFKNLGSPADQFFADGLTEELTSRLAGLSGLRVVSRTSAEQYRDSPKSLREIGAELGAGYVLEGSVRWERTRRTGPGARDAATHRGEGRQPSLGRVHR
jgi:hypothetical protein